MGNGNWELGAGDEGIADFHELVAALTDDAGEVIIATETDPGLFVGALVASGYGVIATNPRATSRYRERHSMSGAKSDPGDAFVLADRAAPTFTTIGPLPATASSSRLSRLWHGRISR